VTLVDIPLIRRLSERGTVLDSEICFTRDAGGPQAARFFTLLLPYGGVSTIIARANQQHVVGQFRMDADEDHLAHITYLAPTLGEDDDDTAWLHLLDAMAVDAGKRGAHVLIAEVDELAPLFTTLRTAAYSIYARQEIWCRPPGEHPVSWPSVELAEVTEDDLPEVHALYGNVIPKLVQQITYLPGPRSGYIYRNGDRVEGFVGVSQGKQGVYLMPLLHPDAFRDAPAIIAAAASRAGRSASLPVYVQVRRYQDWLDRALTETGFVITARQAVMVKHITAGVRTAAFAPLPGMVEGAVPNTGKPPGKAMRDGWDSSKTEGNLLQSSRGTEMQSMF
jgi:hypothetical protein